jgi:two-component system sensor histidine kinase MtrB
MLDVKSKFKHSLSFKVLVTSSLLAILIISTVGFVIHNRISSIIINEKISISKIETKNALQLAQANFNKANLKSDESLSKAIQQFIASSEEDGLISGRETVLLPFSKDNKVSNFYQTGTTLLVLNSIPIDFREKTKASNEVTVDRISIEYSTGSSFPGFIVGSKINIPKTGAYEIYYIFKLDKQFQTINQLSIILIFGGLLLILLIGLSTQFVIRQVISPVQAAAAVAEKFTQGDLSSRMDISDSTEFASLGNSFNEMAVSIQQQIYRLKNLSMLQQRFVSDVSHELRTPLTTLRMAAEVIYQGKDNFDPSITRSSELLINQIDRFELLLADLLEVSRFDAEAASIDLTTFNIVNLVKKTVDYLHPSKATKLLMDSPNELINIEADQRRIERILRNLISNAIDHGEGKTIKVRVAESDNEVAVSVRDFGLGFNENDAPFLFDRFWRADPSRARTSGGSGLGLSISLEDAKLHQGQLLAWGSPNQGAHFVLTIPKNHGGLVQSFPISLVPEDKLSTVKE